MHSRAICTLLLCPLVLVLTALTTARGETRPTRRDPCAAPAAILWVGNSFFYYNNSLHNHFGRLAASAQPAVRVRGTSVTISGSGLDWHDMASLVREGQLGRYSFTTDNEVRFNPPGRQYDTAIIMDCSQCPIHPRLQQAFHDTARRHSRTLADAGIRTALFMSWAYQDKPEMTAQLAEQYTKAGNDNDLVVIPAGLAFARALAERPEVVLHDADKRHPSLAGTYLAAATTYATLFRKSPADCGYTAGLDPELARFLRGVAWATVTDFFRP